MDTESQILKMAEDIATVKQLAVDIKDQTTKTNGKVADAIKEINELKLTKADCKRMDAVESYQSEQKGSIKSVLWVCGAIIAIINLVIGYIVK